MTGKKTRAEELRAAMRRLGLSLPGDMDDVDDDDPDWDEDEDWDEEWIDEDEDPADRAAALVGAAIDQLTVAQLRRIAKDFGWPLKGQLRDDITEQMERHYADPAMIRLALDSVSNEDRQRLALLYAVGLAPRQTAEQQVALFAERLAARQGGVRCTPRDLEGLIARGLVFEIGDGNFARVGVAPPFMHDLPALRLLAPPADLAALRPDPPVEPLTALLAAWQAVADAERRPPIDPYETGSYNAHARWRTLPAEDAATTKAHKVVRIPSAPGPFPEPLRAAMRIAAGIDEPGVGSFLGAILWSLGLVTSDATGFTASSEGRDALLTLDPLNLRYNLFTAWTKLHYGLWDEFTAAYARGEPVRVYRRAQNWYFNPEDLNASLTGLRHAALICARWLPADRGEAEGWASLSDLDALLRGAYPDAVAPGAKSAPWYIAVAPGTPLDGARELDWQRGHAPIWHLIFSGPLRWLGLVETARDPSGKLAALRLTPAAAALLHGTPLPVTPGAGLTWGSALDVTVTPSVASGNVVAVLMQLAELANLPDGRLHFRFTPVAAQRAFQAGALPADLYARLVEAGAPPPAAVAEALATWYEGWGNTHRYDDLALLEVADETLLAEILARPGVAEHGVFRCGPTALALDPAAVDKVVAQLRRWGYLAKVVDA